jgi:hypothetical protein
MNDEYLWNKTGGDAEIEGLENALKAFRYYETADPRIPMQAVPTVEKRTRSIFRLRFTFVFAATAVVVLSGAWFMLPAIDSAISDRAVNAVNEVQLHRLPLAHIPIIDTATENENSQPKAIRATVKIRQPDQIKIKPVRAFAKSLPNEHSQVKLTAEEKYAYDQLMLALSITSSKLKIVKDTVSQIDKPNTAIERYR